MEQKLLDIFLQAQALISHREGMIAEYIIRAYRGEAIAYDEKAFEENSRAFEWLRAGLR